MKKLYLKNAKIVDVLEEKLLEGGIYMEDGLIQAVGAHLSVPEDAQTVDLGGKVVCPGFFDCHIHVTLPNKWEKMRYYAMKDRSRDAGFAIAGMRILEGLIPRGVTFIRDIGARSFIDLELRHGCATGQINGPDMMVAGKIICMTGGHAWRQQGMTHQVDGADSARRAARLNLREGVDFLKVIATGGITTEGVFPGQSQLTIEEMQAVCQEAHKAGKTVASHAQGTEGIKNSLLAGVDSIEHGLFLDDECVDLMLQNGTWYVPTIVATEGLKNATEEMTEAFKIQKAKDTGDAIWRSVKMAHERGVKIAVGTDAGTPGNERDTAAVREMVNLVQAGLTPMESLQAGTINGAALCGVSDSLGSITVGKRAHLAVLDGNPLEDIHAVLRNVMTVKNGEIVYRAAL